MNRYDALMGKEVPEEDPVLNAPENEWEIRTSSGGIGGNFLIQGPTGFRVIIPMRLGKVTRASAGRIAIDLSPGQIEELLGREVPRNERATRYLRADPQESDEFFRELRSHIPQGTDEQD